MMQEERLSSQRQTARRRWADAVLDPSFRLQLATENAIPDAEEEEMFDAVSQTIHNLTNGTTSQAVQTATFCCGYCNSEIEFAWSDGNANHNEGDAASHGWIPWRRAFDMVRVKAAACGGRADGREGERMKVWSLAGTDNYGALGDAQAQPDNESHVLTDEGESGSGDFRVLQLDVGGERNDSAFMNRSQGVSRNDLHIYLTYSNKLGISPCGGTENMCGGKCSTLNKILCVAFSVVSSMQSLRQVKHHALMFVAHTGEVKPFVRVAFNGMLAFTKANFLYLLHFKKPKIFHLVQRIQEVQEAKEEVTGAKSSNRFGTALVIGSMVLALVRASIGTYAYGTNWTAEKGVEHNAITMGKTIFAWNGTNYQNDTNEIGETYVDDMDWKTFLLAGSNTLLDFCGMTQEDLFRNIVLIAARLVNQELAAFLAEIALRGAGAAETAEEKRRKLRWLLRIRALVLAVNDTLGIVMVLLHIDNLLLAGYFLLGQMRLDLTVAMVLMGARLLKVAFIHFYGVKINSANKPILQWLQKNQDMDGVIDENGEYITVAEIIKQFEDDPLVLGLSGSEIQAEFVKQFWTAAISLFLFLANLLSKNIDSPCNCQMVNNTTIADLLHH